jgi:monothiol glutaredoxin
MDASSEGPAVTDASVDTSPVHAFIAQTVSENPVVLFMKGNAEQPQCGFSSLVVQILDHLGVDYATVNVLANDEIRQGIKTYSDWPTIPQLYVKGEFVGGCDIIKEMFQAGELKPFLTQQGVLEAE